MAVDDVALALIDLHDPAVRTRVVDGDLTALRGDLTPEERDLVVDAAADEPEVEGFAIVESRVYPALTYVATNRKQLSVNTRTQFNTFFRDRYGSAWTIALMG